MYLETAYSDAIAQEASLPGWEQEYRQVSPGKFKGRVSAVLYPGLSILRERINVSTEQLFSAPEGSLVFFYYYSSAGPGQFVYGSDNTCPAGFAFDWKDRVGMMGVDSDLLMVVVDREPLSDQIEPRSGRCRGPSAKDAELMAEWLLAVLHTLGDQSFSGDMRSQLNSVLPDLIRDRLTLLLQRSELVQVRAIVDVETVYRKLRDWVHHAPGNFPTVSAMSRALGLQPAVLRRACLQFTGTQLDHFLTLLRLNGARRDLIAARGRQRRVSDVAMDWGFMHWSRFAARYRALFGETPSETRSHA
jgi:AraC family ethanolamine operon transcriptional activator